MYGIRDYLAWRGDLTFAQSPLNVVDLVCLSQLVTSDMDYPAKKSCTLKVLFDYYADSGKALSKLGLIVPFEINLLFKDMAESHRFGNITVKNYVYEADLQKQTQFSAVTFDTSRERIVCFSATDDTIVGWKENFNMAEGKPTYAQLQSVEYLQKACKTIRKVYVIGHSKGGNLALYSLAHCDDTTAERVEKCYCFDGPGLDEKTFRARRMAKRLPKMCAVLPRDSVIGRIFYHMEEVVVVTSNKTGLYQHDCFSWRVRRDSFVPSPDGFSVESNAIESRLKVILQSTDAKQRASLFKNFFDYLYGDGRRTLSELSNNRKHLLSWYMALPKEDKKVCNYVVSQLIKEPAIHKIVTSSLKQMRLSRGDEGKMEKEMREGLFNAKSAK